MDMNVNKGGKIDSASTLTALESLKHVTCSKPRPLTEAEIELLRQSKVEIATRVNQLLELNKAKKE